MGTTKRNYGIDLLRIISMFMIVMLHVLGKGGILSVVHHSTLKGELVWIIEMICMCSVNCFALISGYVGFKSKHKPSSLINLCYQVLFYCFVFTGIFIIFSLCTGTDISLRFIFKSLFPTLAERYWYFSAYFCLFFFMPALDLLVEKLNRKYLQILAILIFIVGCCVSLVTTNVFGLNNGYSVLWLAILYLFGAYISKYKPFKNISPLQSFMVFLGCMTLSYLTKIILPIITNAFFGVKVGTLLLIGEYTSPTMLIASIALLNMFANLNIKRGEKLIKLIAPTTFGIYLIHCQPVIYDYVITNRFTFVERLNAAETLLVALSAGVIIFVCSFVIDFLRGHLFKLIKFDKVVNWTERTTKKIVFWILKICKSESCQETQQTKNEDENTNS